MSTQRKPEFPEDDLSEARISEYLATHPDFFDRHPKLLSSLRLSHQPGGTVSLVERQIAVLRQKDLKLERQLKELISVARANDVLAAKIHTLSTALIAADQLAGTIAAVEEAMRTGFGADQAVLVLFGDPGAFVGVPDVNAGRFLRVLGRDDEALKPFATFLNGAGPRCGQIRDSQREFLFRRDASEIGSAALVPLGRKSETGFIAIGSVDSGRFHPGMSMDFLCRVGDLVATAVKRR